MTTPPDPCSKIPCIDAALLERMGRLAHGFPGRTISLARAGNRSRTVPEKVVLHIDGVAADTVLEGGWLSREDAA